MINGTSNTNGPPLKICQLCGMPEHGTASCESVQIVMENEIDEFDKAQKLADEPEIMDRGAGCDLCGEHVPLLRWTKDVEYLVCEVCWSEYCPGLRDT